MTNMDPYQIQFANGYIEVEERKSPNGTREAKCTLYPMAYRTHAATLFQEVVAWANDNNYTHTKMLMRDGQPYFIAWVSPTQEEHE
jgi:hypothetical protein